MYILSFIEWKFFLNIVSQQFYFPKALPILILIYSTFFLHFGSFKPKVQHERVLRQEIVGQQCPGQEPKAILRPGHQGAPDVPPGQELGAGVHHVLLLGRRLDRAQDPQ